jgi:hypothetical protein
VKILKLTSAFTSDPLFVNADKIDAFRTRAAGRGTSIFIGGATDPVDVAESPDTIVEMIDEAEFSAAQDALERMTS